MRRRNWCSLTQRIVRTSLVCTLGSAASGCAFVEETRSDGTIARSIVVGAPAIVLQPSIDQGAAARAAGLGLALSNGVASLGWFDDSIVALGPDCRVVLVGNSDEQLRRFTELAGDVRNVCGANMVAGGKK